MTQVGATAPIRLPTSDVPVMQMFPVCGNIIILIIVFSFINLAAISTVAKDCSRIINNGLRYISGTVMKRFSVTRNKNTTTFVYNIKAFEIIKRAAQEKKLSFLSSIVCLINLKSILPYKTNDY